MYHFQFPSIAPSGVVYPPTSEMSITVSVSDSSGLVSTTTFPVSQSDAFFNLGNNESYTISVVANHAITGSSTPTTIPLTSIYVWQIVILSDLQLLCTCACIFQLSFLMWTPVQLHKMIVLL